MLKTIEGLSLLAAATTKNNVAALNKGGYDFSEHKRTASSIP